MSEEMQDIYDKRVVKNLQFCSEYVSCLTCDANYGQKDDPIYCQEYNLTINPRDVHKNMNMAKECTHWFPKLIGRTYMNQRKEK